MATSSSRVFSTKRECLDQNSLELSSSANSSASLLAQVKNSSAGCSGIHAKNAMADVKLHSGGALGLARVEMCQAFQTLRCNNVAMARSLLSCCSHFLL